MRWNRAVAATLISLMCAVADAGNRNSRYEPDNRLHRFDNQSGLPVDSFDSYLLALSWSPNYCLTHPRDRAQCSGKGYGFVLHGLWPQFRAGGYPSNCRTSERLTTEAIRFAETIFPSPTLIRHEWDKHGTCSEMTSLDYFRAADAARTAIRIPEMLDAPTNPLTLTAEQLVQVFAASNDTLRSDSIVLICNGPELAEVRFCLDRTIRPVGCGKAIRSNCRATSIRVRSVR